MKAQLTQPESLELPDRTIIFSGNCYLSCATARFYMLRQNVPVILAESNNRNIMPPTFSFRRWMCRAPVRFSMCESKLIPVWFTNNLKNLSLSLKTHTDQKSFVYQVEYILFSFSYGNEVRSSHRRWLSAVAEGFGINWIRFMYKRTYYIMGTRRHFSVK